jgi:tetratricopeptide (TPR) repeat protein
MSTDESDRRPEGPASAAAGPGEGPRSTASGRRIPRWPAALAALAAIGGAAIVIYRSLPDVPAVAFTPGPEGAKPAAQPAAEGALERGLVRSRLAVLRVGEGDGARSMVALARPSGRTKFADILRTDQGIIARELVRQALLIAARDELGLATRDELLDDVPPGKADGAPVEVASVFRTDGPSCIAVLRGEGPAAEPLAEHAMGPVPNEVGILAMILPVAEELSRTEFPKTLRKLGASGVPNRIKDDGALPARVEERLQGLGFIDHFAAVRDLHDAIRTDGESPERLGALARGYAQLGVLTEFHWHPAHKVYKARALLYAQRLAAREPGSAWALRNRAFVRSVIGLHQEALDDLAEASRLAATGKDAATPPWIAPIEAYAKNDLARLGSIDGPHMKLARLLRMLALEYPLGTGESLRAAQEVVGVDVDCYRAHDAMCRVGGVSNLHGATVVGPEAFTKLLPKHLAALAALPEGVRRALDGKADELAVVEALAWSGSPVDDPGEPSWGGLAHLIRETRFVQVARRVIFMRVIWGVPADDYWADVRTFVAGHRYLTFLEAYIQPAQQVRPKYTEFANKVDLDELEPQEPELFSGTEHAQNTREKHDGAFAYGHGDAVARDLAACTQTQDEAFKVGQARVLLAVSPNSTVARRLLIAYAWDSVKDRADAWEKEAGESSGLLESLGWRYGELKQYDRAQRLLRRSVELSPQRSAYESLADTYKARGDMEGWRKTLDEYLAKGEDHGLNHATIRVQIARCYIGEKRWKDAAPYAEAAAATWAGRAMECAVECYEAMGEWERGEAWAQRLSERYPNTMWARWYCDCKRTGRGDIAAARAWTDAYVDSARGRPDLADPYWVPYSFWLSGSTKKARDAFEALFAEKPSPQMGIGIALTADEAGDAARRDAVMEQLCTKMKDQAPKTLAICQLMRDSLAANKPLDLAAVDAILGTIPPETRGNAEFFVGKFLMNRGQAEAGRNYLRKAGESRQTHDWTREIANALCRAGRAEALIFVAKRGSSGGERSHRAAPAGHLGRGFPGRQSASGGIEASVDSPPRVVVVGFARAARGAGRVPSLLNASRRHRRVRPRR